VSDLSFLIVAAGFAILLIGGPWLEARRSRNWEVTEGIVLEIVPIVIPSTMEGIGPRYEWKVKYSYKDHHGVLYRAETGLLPSDPTGGPGSTITIKYDPRDPARSVLP
jgi:hypothetical protein